MDNINNLFDNSFFLFICFGIRKGSRKIDKNVYYLTIDIVIHDIDSIKVLTVFQKRKFIVKKIDGDNFCGINCSQDHNIA